MSKYGYNPNFHANHENGLDEKEQLRSKDVQKRLEICEKMVMTCMSLLKKHGVSEEEFMEALVDTHERKIKYNLASDSVPCSKCKRTMMISNISPFIAKCMYCNSEKVINPYAKYYPEEYQEEPVVEEPANVPFVDDMSDFLGDSPFGRFGADRF